MNWLLFWIVVVIIAIILFIRQMVTMNHPLYKKEEDEFRSFFKGLKVAIWAVMIFYAILWIISKL